MNIKRFTGALCIVMLYSWSGFTPVVGAFQNMVCSSEKADRTVCSTVPEENSGIVKVTCRSFKNHQDYFQTKTCTKETRDWGQSSSPYAHTSTLWRCINDKIEIYIFAPDFDQDATRCDLVCGKCSTKWRTHPSTHNQ